MKEINDIFGEKIVKGNLVVYAPKKFRGKDTMSIGIFLRVNKSSYTILTGANVYNGNAAPITTLASSVILLKDPMYYLNLIPVKKALEAVELLKDGKVFSKSLI